LSRVLVTGGAGFIGSHVAEFFSNNGDEVVVLDNLLRGKLLGRGGERMLYNWSYLREKCRNVMLVEADVRDIDKVSEAANGCDFILHGAAQVAVTTSLTDPVTDFMINSYGTLNILEVARRNDAAVVFLSTNKVYGDGVNRIRLKEQQHRYVYDDPNFKEGIPENFPVDGTSHTPYGCSKLAADIYVQDYGRIYGLETVVFRMSCIYGERQFGVEDQGWLAHFALKALKGEHLTIYGNGKQVRDVLYVGDLVRAVEMAYENSSRLHGEVFNIGGGPENTLSLLEAIKYFEELVGKKVEYVFRDWRPADQLVYISNIKKAQQVLGWRPAVGWREGIKRMYEWLRAALRDGLTGD
jgi:CDP-paratose 2-epimerase